MVSGYEIDDDSARVDVEAVWTFLSTQAYWGRYRSRVDVEVQVSGAWRVVGAYAAGGDQVGFARAVSDGVGIAYLADVYVLAAARGHGLGVALVEEMIERGPGRSLRWMLHTSDAHGLYRRYGFAAPGAGVYLERPRGGAVDDPQRSRDS
jgi:GNAT superfamily N-acetyltransferase